jgi:hypothetical protein
LYHTVLQASIFDKNKRKDVQNSCETIHSVTNQRWQHLLSLLDAKCNGHSINVIEWFEKVVVAYRVDRERTE